MFIKLSLTMAVAVLSTALRLSAQQAGEFPPLAAIPEIPSTSGPVREVGMSPGGGVFPHVAFGGPWKTVFAIVNPSKTSSAKGRLEFYASNGTPLTLSFSHKNSTITGTTFTLDVGPKQTVFLETASSSSDVRVGYSLLKIERGSLIGTAVFRASISGRPDLEAVVPLESPLFWTDFSFDNTNGFVTSIALSHGRWNDIDSKLVFEIYNEAGELLGVYRKTLQRSTHMAFETNTEFPASANQKGSIHIGVENTGAMFSALALLFNPSGAVTSLLIYTP